MPILLLKNKDGSEPPKSGDDDVVLSAMDKRIERKLVTPQRLAIAAGGLLLIAVTAYAYWHYGLTRTLTVGSERLTVSKVSYGTFREYIPVTGNVVPRTTVYLDAISGGQVTEVRVEEGAFVKAGDPIVTFKNTELQLRVIQTESQASEQLAQLSNLRMSYDSTHLRNLRDLVDVEYNIDRLQRELKRKRPLVATGGATVGQIDDLEAELKRYQGWLEQSKEALRLDEEFRSNQIARMNAAQDAMNKNLSITRENLENLVIVAPITGQLTLLDANIGESKTSGQRIGQVDEVGAFKVNAFIDEFYLTRVAIGQVATVDIDGKTYELTVSKVYPEVTNRQFEVDLLFKGDPPAGIRRGQTVRMRLEIGQPADTLVLANGAFFDDTGGQWVFVVDPSGDFAERRPVRFGRRNPEGVEVLGGLKQGEEVITSSYESFLNFDRIQFRADHS
ncbi:MAG TPA: HlyD family efflux transporter periplasmic adaptor subunit [Gammaproteobacteria bacterium]|jgi:HlyD family secretion protein|nr:HlyD family efflux transporter periplasmic adaptor subunit [Gammaproteobacteria bacterium]